MLRNHKPFLESWRLFQDEEVLLLSGVNAFVVELVTFGTFGNSRAFEDLRLTGHDQTVLHVLLPGLLGFYLGWRVANRKSFQYAISQVCNRPRPGEALHSFNLSTSAAEGRATGQPTKLTALV